MEILVIFAAVIGSAYGAYKLTPKGWS